jgi:hypothetical protein
MQHDATHKRRESMLNESEAWLLVAEQVLEDTELMCLCPNVSDLCNKNKITWQTKHIMGDRIEMHLGEAVWAYEWSDLFTEEYREKYKEARCLAALWLSCEAEAVC